MYGKEKVIEKLYKASSMSTLLIVISPPKFLRILRMNPDKHNIEL